MKTWLKRVSLILSACKNKETIATCLYFVGCVALLITLLFGVYKIIRHTATEYQTVVVRDTVLVARPADTVIKFKEKIVYKYVKPDTIYESIGKVDSFLIENPRGIIEVSKRKNTVKVKAYFSDTARLYVQKVPHSNFDVILTYNDVKVRSPRLKVDYLLGIYGGKNLVDNAPEFGVNGIILFNEKYGIQGYVNNTSVGIGIVKKF